ncbi:DUF512 domain-containing protein [Hathewaya histolytica]|uniref:Fe-S oxidoreductase, related to NifB/MoaA family with PDZ N-terminal domain n=1 Tax=Hathewaya histolytica TaxID=1498 RepID=A0A4U9RMY9_HATHI|nr:DUF512 domain-containing protein [Hathewaya histolytica]VTQ90240.1 fe-S oxidoreductase, related to NifB/MoaA family with PDZ N-terminal domain [Hathewaya histolytica]
MKNYISYIKPYSIAEEAGIEVGDFLISINNKKVNDIIDYKFLITEEYLTLNIEKSSGEIWEVEIEKDYDEELGLEFKQSIIDSARSCTNKCIFCFIDQMPKGMRNTLYFKDDDSRLAFLQGNFVTLTNMKEEEIQRIIDYKISPINISVHTTNPELRVKMLKNRFAGKVYKYMERFAEAGIIMNCQIVLCPGINNGDELKNTIEDLYKLYPQIRNVAAVPVGITKFREGLHEIEIYSKETAKKEIEELKFLQEKYIKNIGNPFIRLSDEFYVLAEEEIPETKFYGDFGQIEDGVGMIRALRNNIEGSLEYLENNKKVSFTMATGTSAYRDIKNVANVIMKKNPNISINVERILNNFFGETITVSGLLTGVDIINQLKGKELGDYIILPDNIIRKGYELAEDDKKILLDDYTINDLEKELQREIILCDYTGEDLINIINEFSREE